MPRTAQRILFCASEAYPLIKTGGLADVAGSLTQALLELGQDVWLVLPAYQQVLRNLPTPPQYLTQVRIGQFDVSLLRSILPGTNVPIILVACPTLYDRPGSPYVGPDGYDWPDNAERFAVFNEIIAMLAMDQFGLDWRADIVHANDWQTGLVPVLLHEQPQRPATVFTIHNLAYQGYFDRQTFERLALPENLWHYERLEYHGGFAFIKGGLVYADRINTVSPSYASEIQTPAFGHGLDGLLRQRQAHLSGIINGIDARVWNPATDSNIAQTYNAQQLALKQANKADLQRRMHLPERDDVLLLGIISRLAAQKGIDLVIDSLPGWISDAVQLVIVGSGDKLLEQRLTELAQILPDKIAVHLKYDEVMAHRVEAGIDAFMMPSRFEPCGLNQMYSQVYGSLPIVSPVGGLRDTVRDAESGFVMQSVTVAGLVEVIQRALRFYHDKPAWAKLQDTAMRQDYSWEHSARQYLSLYQQARLQV